jgi:hypothetical protein
MSLVEPEEPVIDFDTIWNRILAHTGETFHQMRGGEFTYRVRGNSVIPDRVNQVIPRAHFSEAFHLVPLANTVSVQHLRGPAYIYAIMMDPRIRQQDWGDLGAADLSRERRPRSVGP